MAPNDGFDYFGKVRCPLYDTIGFSLAEKLVMDSPEFQRLRRIKQTAFTHFVFPGATHTRFEHSLGVMHMAGVFLASLIRNQKVFLSGDHPHSRNPEIARTADALELLIAEPWLTQVVRFAGLLHDLGHAPFSHSGERFLPRWSQVASHISKFELPDWLRETFNRKIARYQTQGNQALQIPVRHEFYSLLLIEQLFRRLSANLEDVKETESRTQEPCQSNSGQALPAQTRLSRGGGADHQGISQVSGRGSKMISPEMAQDICALIDKDVPIRKSSPLEAVGLRTILSEIITGEIDADRMDYLRRDSKHCGVVYGMFDAGRILDTSLFYRNLKTNELHLALRRSGVAAYEDFLKARMSMYQQVYFHKTGTACEAMLVHMQRRLNNFTLPLDPVEYLKYDDSSFYFLAGNQWNDFDNFREDLENLLINRKLWKRVYEESVPKFAHLQGYSGMSLALAIVGFLRSQGMAAELVESETNLTRFSPRGRNGKSGLGLAGDGNSLKVISKDVRGDVSLQPIEDHSRLINNLDEERILRRIFVGVQSEMEVSRVQELIAGFVEGKGFEE